MATYDKVAHLIGAIALGFLGLASNPTLYSHLPWWVMAGASVVAFAVQATTMPAAARPIAIAESAAATAAAPAVVVVKP